MTTIAYKGGIMACDSCWSGGAGDVVTLTTKIMVTKGGCLLGTAGEVDSRDLEELLGRAKTPKQLPTHSQLRDIHTDSSAMLVFPDGRIFYFSTEPANGGKSGSRIYSPEMMEVKPWGYFAIGSGGRYARVAMRCGANATEAVEIACEFDTLSRPPVHRLALGVARRLRSKK